MADLAFKRLLDRYLELHSSVMVDAVRAGISVRQRGSTEPKRARPFCNTWADVLATARGEVAALQGAHAATGGMGQEKLLLQHSVWLYEQQGRQATCLPSA